MGTTSSGISYHLREIYSICRCCWNVATYKWENWNHLFCRKVSFLTAPHCRFRGVGQLVFDWQHICYVWRTCFSNTVGIPMCTSCAPLLAVLFLYSHEADFIQGLLKKNENKLTWSFNFTFRYIDVLSLNNSRFGDFVDRIYPIELEI
jgi:hypothetical protein